MTTLRTAARQALEAWDNDENGTLDHPLSGAMETLRAALEQHDEDVEWMRERHANWRKQKEFAEANAALKQPEQEYVDTLAEFETQAGSARQWVSVGAWLYPGERIVHLSTKLKEKNA